MFVPVVEYVFATLAIKENIDPETFITRKKHEEEVTNLRLAVSATNKIKYAADNDKEKQAYTDILQSSKPCSVRFLNVTCS